MTIWIIGLGSMGKRRIRLIRQMYPGTVLIGIDSAEERQNDAARQFGIECFLSMEAAAEHHKPDCVFVCTSPLSHADLIHRSLEKGYHVFTEINLVADGYRENMALAKQKGLTLFLSSTPIYRDEMRSITELVAADGHKVSYVYHVGQYLPDWHPWETYKDFFVGKRKTNGCREILAIELPWMCRAFGEIEDIQVMSAHLTDLDIDYCDQYMVQIAHTNGNVGTFIVDVVCRKAVRRLEVYNEDLYIEWEGTPQTLRKLDIHNARMEEIPVGKYHNEPGYSEFVNEYAYMNEIRAFFETLQGAKPLYTMVDDEKILAWIDRIEKG